MNKYTVIKDTREKDGQGWVFSESQACTGTVRGTLATGDYTLRGYEDIVCIERKACVAEFAKNICEDRFWKELERMRDFPLAALILEFSDSDIMMWPSGSGIPKSRWKYLRVNRNFIYSSVKKIAEEFPNIRVILAGNEGRNQALALFEEAISYGSKTPKVKS